MERVTGIEPAYFAWEANVLPLNYTRNEPTPVARNWRDGQTNADTENPRQAAIISNLKMGKHVSRRLP